MLPSKYSISSTDRSISSNHHRHHQQQQHVSSSMSSQQPQQPPLGITGVVCTSQMIDLPNQRGQLHCTIYRPRMLQQQQQQNVVIQKSSSNNNNTSTSNKLKLNIPKVPQPNPPLICVCGGPNMSCQYLTGLVHIITDRAIIIYDHLHCGQSTGSSSYNNNNNTNNNNQMTSVKNDHINDDNDTKIKNDNDDNNDTTITNNNYNCTFLENTMNDLRIVIQTIIPNNTKYHLFGHSMGGIIVYEYLKQEILMKYNNNINSKLQQETTVTGNNNNEYLYKSYCLSCILASTPMNIQKSIQSKYELIQNIINELKQTGYDRTNVIKQNQHDDVDDDDDDENDINEQQQILYAAQIEFQKRHECRVDPIPLSLQQSLTGLYRSTSNNNNKNNQKQKITTIASYQQQYQYPSLNNYIAKPILLERNNDIDIDIVKDGTTTTTTTINEIKIKLPPALIIRGQYDFILETNCRDWENIFQNESNSTNHTDHTDDNKNNMKHCQYITISNCSHYGFLEQESLYGNVIMSFLHDHDNDTMQW